MEGLWDRCDLGPNPIFYSYFPKNFTVIFIYGSEGSLEPLFYTWSPPYQDSHVVNPWRGGRLCPELTATSKAKGFLSCPRSEYECGERIALTPFFCVLSLCCLHPGCFLICRKISHGPALALKIEICQPWPSSLHAILSKLSAMP